MSDISYRTKTSWDKKQRPISLSRWFSLVPEMTNTRLQRGAVITRSIFSITLTKDTPIARQWGRGAGIHFWVLCVLIGVLYLSLNWCVRYRVVLNSVMLNSGITASDGISKLDAGKILYVLLIHVFLRSYLRNLTTVNSASEGYVFTDIFGLYVYQCNIPTLEC